MPKIEGDLKAALQAQAKVTLVGYHSFYVAGVGRDGIPDLVFNGRGRTSWWEVKHATPRFEGTEQQERECLLLSATSACRYLVYYEKADGSNKMTYIFHPREVQRKKGDLRTMTAEAWTTGHDHAWACEQIRRHH